MPSVQLLTGHLAHAASNTMQDPATFPSFAFVCQPFERRFSRKGIEICASYAAYSCQNEMTLNGNILDVNVNVILVPLRPRMVIQL